MNENVKKQEYVEEGRVLQIIGAVVDVKFPKGKLPSIHNSIHVITGDDSHGFVTHAMKPERY